MLCCGAAWLFLHAPFIPAASFLLYHQLYYQLHLLLWFFGAGFLSLHCGHLWHARELRDDIYPLRGDWWFFSCCFVLFPFWWWVRTAGVFFGSGQKISEGCQMLVIFTYFWLLQVNQTEGQEASGGSRLPSGPQGAAESGPQGASSSVSPQGWEGGREVPLRTLNTEGYLNGKWYYWGLARRQEFRFTIKLKFDVFLFHMRKKQKPFHC